MHCYKEDYGNYIDNGRNVIFDDEESSIDPISTTTTVTAIISSNFSTPIKVVEAVAVGGQGIVQWGRIN